MFKAPNMVATGLFIGTVAALTIAWFAGQHHLDTMETLQDSISIPIIVHGSEYQDTVEQNQRGLYIQTVPAPPDP